MAIGISNKLLSLARFEDLLTLVLLILLFQLWNRSKRSQNNSPPGPRGFPIIGHLPLLGRQPHNTLVYWKGIYGPIMQVWFGSYRAVVIQDVHLIREALNLKTFSGRPSLNFLLERSLGNKAAGVVVSEGSHWLQQRRFAIRFLRDQGFGTTKMEASSQFEAAKLVERLKTTHQKPTQVLNLFNIAVVNPLWTIMFGQPLDQNDPEANEASHRMNTAFEKNGNLGSLPVFMPWLAKYAPNVSGYNGMIEDIFVVKTFAKKQLERHVQNYVEDQPRDFMDVYRDAVRKAKGTESSFYDEEQMVYVAFDFFAASGETIATVLSWMCAYLVHFPQIQIKFQNEIDAIIAPEAIPSLAHRQLMPYTQALINETMRFASINPYAVVHSTTQDLVFHGFFIPKDTMVVPNVYCVHFDENLWGDPENFRPERFLDEQGKFKASPHFLAFSTGRRICPGEVLGRDELFLYSTAIFRKFSVYPADKMPDLEPHCGFTHSPHPFEVIWKEREN